MDSLNLKCLISREEIDSAVKRLAADIRQDFHDKNPLVIGILKGSFVFLADLVRALDFPHEVEFVRLSSYGSGSTSTGQITMIHDLHVPIEGRHVLVVEDIVDTGNSVAFLMNYLSEKNPASLKLCALTDKPSRRQVDVQIDYRGFIVPNRFLVGYGLDYNEKYRNLPDICTLREVGEEE
ncbi:MAG: hypoxanthine phosphoribosyltransferase [Dehalococcoidales bacterium]|nr:hypoxanthine phosphoribosyltransferase [Dehalococcoidales bacterium]